MTKLIANLMFWALIIGLLALIGLNIVRGEPASPSLAGVRMEEAAGNVLSGAAPAAPSPPIMVATKALRGDFGPLAPWQEKAYRYALEQATEVAGLCWLTHYTPHEGYDRGEATAYGYGCSERTAAANEIPAHHYVLLEVRPGFWEMRQVQDTGRKYNDRIARRNGARLWIDRWSPKANLTNVSRLARYAVIRAEKTW